MAVILSIAVAISLLVAGWYFGGLKAELIFPLLITTWVAITGWYVADWYSKKRDRANKQRDLRVQYLIEAYRRIEVLCARDHSSPATPEMARGLESAIADIQLFGTSQQIQLARAVVKEVETSSYSDPRVLLADLRHDLRQELHLEARSTDPSDIMHFRVKSFSSVPAANGAQGEHAA